MRAIIYCVSFYTDLGEPLVFRRVGSEEEHHVGRYAAWAFIEGKNQVVDTSDDLVKLKEKWGVAPVHCVKAGDTSGREG